MNKWNETLVLNKKFYQGQLTEKHFNHPEKIKNSPIIITFRSSYERKFAMWLDSTPDVEYWASEAIWLPYNNPAKNKVCQYYPDFFAKIKNELYLIEIKPSAQLNEPSKKKWKQYKNWVVNKAKFQAAEKFCNKNGLKFKIITEKDLF